MDEKRPNMSKTISLASQMMMGVGPPLHKQLKFAILEGNEDKAIGIYNAKEMGKTLKSTLHPSKPFPSKKDPNGETPLHLSAKFALAVLFGMFLEFGGRPDIINSRRENCIHTVCSQATNPLKRAEIVEEILKWRSVNPSTNKAVAVPVDATDIDGNTALHLAACNGLLLCIEKLLAYNVSTAILNNNNLTCAEFADVSGRTNVGSMVELACLFRPASAATVQSLEAVRSTYRNLLQTHESDGRGIVYIDSDSLTAQSLMKFVARVISHVSAAIKESAARTEVLLMHYNWDARALIGDYLRNAEEVLKGVQLAYHHRDRGDDEALTIHKESENAVIVHGSDNVPVGVPIADVLLDPSYQELGPFTVYRGGKKVSYTIRTVHGKTAVVPLDFDPHAKMLMADDQKVSANSHLKPETTTVCPMCGELMHEAASVQHFLADTLVEPLHRELACGSGHKYCFSCWCGHLQALAAGEDGLHGLRCPSVNCGETLDLHWAPVLLKSPDLMDRLFAQRQREIIVRLRLRWCPLPKCGMVVHVHSVENEEARGSDCSAGSIPLCGICSNGHGFCLCCGYEAHSPCKCEELSKWQDLVREFSRTAQAKDRNHAANILLHAPNHKNCTQCGASNGKVDGCNRMRCTGCFREFCWLCLQSWSLHCDPANPNPVPPRRQSLSQSGSRDQSEADAAEVGGGGKEVFQCNLWLEPSATVNLFPDKQTVFLRYFARYQAHWESQQLETAAFKQALDRVTHDLKATYDGELEWLLGDTRANPYSPAQPDSDAAGTDSSSVLNNNKKTPSIDEAYVPREACLEFLTQAYQELERCRMLLRWSYPFSLFQFEDEFRKVYTAQGMVMVLADRTEYKLQFTSAQAALELRTEELSELLSHKRIRGSQEEISAACLAAKAARTVLEAGIVEHNPSFSAQSLEYSRSMSISRDDANRQSFDLQKQRAMVGGGGAGGGGRDSREMRMIEAAQAQGPLQTLSVAPAQARLPDGVLAVPSAAATSSYSRAMEIDVAMHKTAAAATAAHTTQQNHQQQQSSVLALAAAQQEEDADYGYSSADEEGLQVCNDMAAMKLDGSPPQRERPTSQRSTQHQQQQKQQHQQQRTFDTEGQRATVEIERERAVQQTQQSQQKRSTTTTTTTNRVVTAASTALSGQTNSGSGNSLISDLTSPEFNNSSGTLLSSTGLTFNRVSRINSATATAALDGSPSKVPQHPSPLLAQATSNTALGRGAGLVKTPSMSSKQLSREVNKVFQKRTVEHISEQEVMIVYQLMSKHKISREKAVRMYLEEHDERLYNPKAVYLFPGENYIPEEEVVDEEEERRKDSQYGRVQYKVKTDADSLSEASPSTVEQRLIGAKKDPDQEALEHAMLLSSQEQEFGINMYDSLNSDDQITLQEYMNQGFTREEGALIIFEEKFGKTKNLQNSSVIPAMPTLHAVHGHGHGYAGSHSHTGTSSMGGYGSEEVEDDDEEVEDLICRGYTREQAIAVIVAHRERARIAAATSHPTDPTHYDPHPLEEQFNLTEAEEREVEENMNRRGCSRRAAVETIVAMRRSSTNSATAAVHRGSHTSSSSYGGNTSYEDASSSAVHGESYEVRRYMDQGYSREQALQLVRQKSSSATARSSSVASSSSGVDSAFSMGYSATGSYSEDLEVVKYMDRGYSREQALEMVRREHSSLRPSSTNDSLTYSPTPPTPYHPYVPVATTTHTNVVPADLDPATAELVRQQDEDHGTNMFLEISPEDDPEVERLMLEGYQYHEALLEIFTARYPPRPMGRQYTTGYGSAPPPQFPPVPVPVPMAAHSQSFYQAAPMQQYPPMSAAQSFYMPQQQYPPMQYAPPHQQSFYGQPVMGQSFYQQPPPHPAQAQYGMQPQQEPFPTQYVSKPGHARRPSGGNNSAGNGKPPVLNGTQQSLLQQKRQDKERAAQAAAALSSANSVESGGNNANGSNNGNGNGKELGQKKSSSLLRKSSFLSGFTRKTANTEDDIMARATHMSGADAGHHDGQDKEKVPKLKYKEADVQKIVKMGFTRDQAVQALVESNHNVDEAIHTLTS